MRRINLLGLGSLMSPAFTALVVLVGAGLFLEGAALLLRAPILPAPGEILRATFLLIPSLLLLLLPLSLLIGWLIALRRWEEDGTWLALSGAGVRGRRLLPLALSTGIVVALSMAWIAHDLAPSGRRGSARLFAEAVSPSRLLPGRMVQLGPVLLYRAPEGWTFFESSAPAFSGVAQDAELVPGELGWSLKLGGGRVMIGSAERAPAQERALLSFQQASLSLSPDKGSRRLELDERKDRELRRLASRRQQAGDDGSYELNILYKRTAHPIGALLLPVLAIPLGLRWRGRPSEVLLVGLLWWGLVRLGDRLCSTIGPLLASSLPAIGVGLCALVLWVGWRER